MFSTFSFITFFPSVNINSVEVELKQWLYKNGDQCLHNTGGWMKCLVKGEAGSVTISFGGTVHATVNTGITFNENAISFICNASSPVSNAYGGAANYYWGAPSYSVSANFGTRKPLRIDIMKYTKVVLSSGDVNASFRVGVANGTEVAHNTATVLSNGSANRILNLGSAFPYMVIGASGVTNGQPDGWGTHPEGIFASIDCDCTITEIYLV